MVTVSQLRWIQRGLLGLQGILLVGAAWQLVAMFTPGFDGPRPVHAAGVYKNAIEQPELNSVKSLDWYAPLWKRDLRQPPIPRVINPVVESPPLAELPRLLGTFVDNETAFAQLRTSGGNARMCGLNDRVEECKIVKIESGRVLVQRGPNRYWLEVPRLDTKGRSSR